MYDHISVVFVCFETHKGHGRRSTLLVLWSLELSTVVCSGWRCSNAGFRKEKPRN